MNRILISHILRDSVGGICSYLKVEEAIFPDLLHNCVLREELSGCNYRICPIDFFDARGNNIGSLCVKYSVNANGKEKAGLLTEACILRLLETNGINCPKVIHAGIIEGVTSYILLEEIKEGSLVRKKLSLEEVQAISEGIHLHEKVLSQNLKNLHLESIEENIRENIDFERKIHALLAEYVPNAMLIHPVRFLNTYLNSEFVRKSRTIVTDRSIGNFLKDNNHPIFFIDFSTLRIGSRYDNWIQFIDDPRAVLACRKEEITSMYFEKNELTEQDTQVYCVASIYTNLLQGIYTYKKDPALGIRYFENANESFMRFTNKKGMLIRVGN